MYKVTLKKLIKDPLLIFLILVEKLFKNNVKFEKKCSSINLSPKKIVNI